MDSNFGVEEVCPRRESNPHLRFRKPLFYPLNYGDESEVSTLDMHSEIVQRSIPTARTDSEEPLSHGAEV